jgi:hypothetical protein
VKRILTLALLLAGTALAETWNGTLVDVMCRGKDLAGHTRQCALDCARSGFAVVTAGGKFLKLDESGNAKALAALKASTKNSDLKVRIAGAAKDGVIHVDTLELLP